MTDQYSTGLQITLAGSIVPLSEISVGEGWKILAGDVSSFAGVSGDLRITALSVPFYNGFNRLYLDNVVFSSQPIPEPKCAALLALGTAVLAWRAQRGRGVRIRSALPITVSGLAAVVSAFGQSTFQNLDFESAALPVIPPGQSGGRVAITAALPGWRGYIGTNEIATVRHNDLSIGQAALAILGPNYGYSLQGSFTPVLQAGRDPFTGESQNAPVAIAQSGLIPADAQWMTFFTGPSSHDFSVSFNGTVLPWQLLTVASSSQLYRVDVSACAGQSGELRFTSLIPALVPFNNLYLDNIVFVPEPSGAALIIIGGLFICWYMPKGERGK